MVEKVVLRIDNEHESTTNTNRLRHRHDGADIRTE